MSTLTTRQAKMLRMPFVHATKPRECIGVEIEAGLVDPVTGVSRPYHGPRGVSSFLRLAAEEWQAVAHYEGKNIIGLKRSDGIEIGLESGCAIEYGSMPDQSLVRLAQKANRDLHELANIANRLDLALLSGAMLPFDDRDNVHWSPKPRIPLMLEHFQREIGATSQGWAAMAQIITVQTTLDFIDAADLCRKHRMANVVSPLVAALCVNSPIQASQLAGISSRRMQIWTEVDSRRVGMFEHSINADFSVDNLIEWAVQLPMIYRVINGKITAAPPYKSFETLLKDGFGDGTFPVFDDWIAMLDTTWPYVRVRNTLEFRIADGLSQQYWTATPALWLGLTYDRQSCEDAWNLARGYSLKAYLDAVDDVAVRGLDASIDGHPIRPMCHELLNIARDGLWRRVKGHLESEVVLGYLDPLFEVVEAGETFASQLSERWGNDWAYDPKRYVEAYEYR
jgi:glutamate--cysteine ligase